MPQKLSHMNIVVDKMHTAGHVDVWCKKTGNPQLYPELHKVIHTDILCTVSPIYIKCTSHQQVNNEVCEQYSHGSPATVK